MEENVLTLEYRSFSSLEGLADLSRPLPQVSLNVSIPWEIELHKEITHLNAALHQLQLRSLDILGRTNHIRLTLSKPAETIYIYISGGIHHSVIHVPPNVGVRVQVSGGATNLVFVEQHIGSLDEELTLESSNFNSAEGLFNCPCHSSVFTPVGEVVGGPAPRPMDIFPIEIEEGVIYVDTSKPIQRENFDPSQVTYA